MYELKSNTSAIPKKSPHPGHFPFCFSYLYLFLHPSPRLILMEATLLNLACSFVYLGRKRIKLRNSLFLKMEKEKDKHKEIFRQH